MPTRSRLPVVSCGLALAVLVASLLATPGRARSEDAFSRAPYVQMSRPTGIEIVWRTEGEIDPIVRFGRAFDRLDRQVDRSIRVKEVARDRSELRDPTAYLHSAPRGTRQYEASLDDLEAGTTYFYAIYDGVDRLTPVNPTYRFRTHPKAGEVADVLFWVVGDSGTGEERQSEVHEAMLLHTGKNDRSIDLALHVGDMAYENGTDAQFQEHYFEMYEPTLRQAVMWPAMGNHEGRSARGSLGIGPYFDAYICPTRGEADGAASGNESYYAFDYGNIHFVVLNSFDVNRTDDGAMASWLREDLALCGADWLIAYWHHPPYSKGTHDTDVEQDSIEMRSQIMPILETHGVDLVLTGHSHIYERSMLMDGAYDTPTTAKGVILDDGDGDPEGDGPYRKLPELIANQGTVQVVAGNGGTEVERMGTMPVMKHALVEHGSVLIRIRENVLEGRMINFDGQVRDRFQLRKEAGVVVTRMAKPRTLPPHAPWGGEVPAQHLKVISAEAAWAYQASEADPADDWMQPSFDVSSWPRGKGEFGFGETAETLLDREDGARPRLYVRRSFTLPERTLTDQLGLALRYDDAFIAYLNGHEVLRHGVGSGRGTAVTDLATHDRQSAPEYFSLKEAANHFLAEGENVLAIEVHARSADSEGFCLHIELVEKLSADKAEGEAPPLMTRPVLPVGADWRFSVAREFEAGWADPEFDDSAWDQGPTPMGYGRELRIQTSLEAMENAFTKVCFRRTFTVSDRDDLETLGLQIIWDDGFIAYLNGSEIGRAGVARGSGDTALGFGKTGFPSSRYFPFDKVQTRLREGPNVIAIEGHNQAKDSSDYFMAPSVECP